jgi:hypothetical protein
MDFIASNVFAGKAGAKDNAHTPAEDWRQHAPTLAAWVNKYLVNRRDVWGGYYAGQDGKTGQTTHKQGKGKGLSLTHLTRHFKAKTTADVAGLHSTVRDENGQSWSRWGVIDIDRHGDDGDPEANLRYAIERYEQVKALGLTVFLFDSNGRGGYHLLVLFDRAVETEKVFAFLQWLISGWKDAGLDGQPETFPKQPCVTDEHPCGNWWRLPGRHHTRDHYTRVWDGEKWLEGTEAVKAIVTTRGGDPGLIPAEALAEPRRSRFHVIATNDPFTVEATNEPEPKTLDDTALAADALRFLGVAYYDDYDPWLKVGFALYGLGTVGLGLWDQWSKPSTKYEPGACETKWKTMSPNGVTLGSLFEWAKRAGWKWPGPTLKASGAGNQKPPEGPPGGAGPEPQAGPRKVDRFSNFRAEERRKDGETQVLRTRLDMGEIGDSLGEITGGWPKRVGPMLFVEGGDGWPHYLDSAPKLFAWVDRRARVDWTKGSAFITQERFYEDQRVNAPAYEAIEVAPHFPPIPSTYYMHPPVPGPGGKLDGLLDFFKPETRVDRELIKAFILTMFWGGQPGRRPAFLITGPTFDSERGRGLGKSTAVEILADELGAGMFEVPPTGDMETVKTRLLSPDAMFKRVCRLDNVKALRFSWAELEGLMTAPRVNGRRLYVGDGSRSNTLVWAITVNGESLSEDLSQRCVQIKVARPSYRKDWEADVRRYIRENRAGLLGDIKHALANPDRTVEPSGRWASWECEVLAATARPEESQWGILERRKTMNADQKAADRFREYVRDRLAELGKEPDNCFVFIHSAVMYEWLDRAERTKHASNKANETIRGFGIPELQGKRKNTVRGWHWTGKDYAEAGEPSEIDWQRAFPRPFS